MNHVKMLGLLAVATAALMAFAGTASATLTEGEGDPVDVGDTFHASSGANSLTGSIALVCQKSTIGGEVTTNHANEASGPVNILTFEECGNHTVTVTHKGTLRITDEGSNTGKVYSTGAGWTWLWHSAILGTVHCMYQTNGTFMGTLTGSNHGSNTTATLDIPSVPIPRPATDGMCGEHSTLEATYTFSTPDTLLID